MVSSIKLQQVIKSINSFEKLVDIKKYIPVKNKLALTDEYNRLLQEHINDFENQQFYVSYVFLRMIIVKGYTNIDFEYSYDDYDILEEYGIIDKILKIAETDCEVLIKVISSSNSNEG